MKIEELGFTKEDIIDKLAEKIISVDYASDDYESKISTQVQKKIDGKLTEAVNKAFLNAIDEKLNAILDTIISGEVRPVNIWGEPVGEKTTIRDQLTKRAKDFWLQKVDKNGKACDSYYGVPRHEHLMQETVKKEFESVVKANIDGVISGLKEALRVDLMKVVDDQMKRAFKS